MSQPKPSSSKYAVWHGVDAPPQELRPVKAGPLTAFVDSFDLRYVSAGGVEVVRRIYAAVRDRHWNTIPGEALAYELDDRGGSFGVRFAVRHESRDSRRCSARPGPSAASSIWPRPALDGARPGRSELEIWAEVRLAMELRAGASRSRAT
jgi:hypothetical protein